MSWWLLWLQFILLLGQVKGIIHNRNCTQTLLCHREDFRFSRTTQQIGKAFSSIKQIHQGHVYDLEQPLKAAIIDQNKGAEWEASYWIDEDGIVHLKEGIAQDIWGYITLHSGLVFNITATTEEWGPSAKTNDSLVYLLQTGQIDVSMTTLAHCCDRYQVHDFTPIVQERDYVVVFYPAELEKDIYFHIFAPNLWLALIGVLCLLFLVMYLFIWIERTKPNQPDHFGFEDCLSWICCVVCQQGFTKTPITLSGKIVFLIGFITGTLVFQGFVANVTTILSRSETINSLEALIQLNTMQIHQSYFPPFQKELANSKKTIVQDLVRKIQSNKNGPICTNLGGCDKPLMNRMAFENDPNVAFVGPELYLRDEGFFEFNRYQNLPCKLKWFLVPMGKQKVMYGIRKHLPQKRKIDMAFYRLRETGLLQKTMALHRPKSPHCESLNSFRSKFVSLYHVMGAYVCLFSGYLFAMILFMGEKLTKNKNLQA